jgi:hypothetical protein
MDLTIAQKQPMKVKVALQGKTQTGKTMSALLLAFGITGNWSKIAVIDTESNSASLYCSLGKFNTIQISHSFSPINYIEAIKLCEEAQIEVVIIDSISPEWIGFDGVLSQYCASAGDRYRRWDEVMTRHMQFMETIEHASMHIIATVRVTGEKVRAPQGYESSFTTVLSLNHEHIAAVIKDRTKVCSTLCPTVITAQMGALLYEWCNSTEEVQIPPLLQLKLSSCQTVNEVYALLITEDIQPQYIIAFTKRRLELEGNEFTNRRA